MNEAGLSLAYVLKAPQGAPDSDPMPLVFVLHGRGADANDLADLAPMLGSGYRFVFPNAPVPFERSEEHTSELQSRFDLVCRLLLEKKKKYEKRVHLQKYKRQQQLHHELHFFI